MQFNNKIAVVYGVEEAVMIENIYWWVEKNRANGQHFYDGRYWTYNSHKAFKELFPFWTLRQVQRILENCQKRCAIMVGNFNKSGYNRTNWYTITDDVNAVYVSENLHTPKRLNASNETGVSIQRNGYMDTPQPLNAYTETGVSYTDINTYINHIENTDRESAIAFLKRESISRYETEILMKYQTALGAEFADWEKSYNAVAVIECENNKLPWTVNALLARAQKYADTWVRNNKTKAVQGFAGGQQNTPSPASNRLELKKRV